MIGPLSFLRLASLSLSSLSQPAAAFSSTERASETASLYWCFSTGFGRMQADTNVAILQMGQSEGTKFLDYNTRSGFSAGRRCRIQ